MESKSCSMNRNDIVFNLKEGLKAEYRAVDVYKELLPKLTDKTDQNTIELVIEDEKKHIRFLEEMIITVNENL